MNKNGYASGEYMPVSIVGYVGEQGITLYTHDTFDPDEIKEELETFFNPDKYHSLFVELYPGCTIAEEGMNEPDYCGYGKLEMGVEVNGDSTRYYALHIVPVDGQIFATRHAITGFDEFIKVMNTILSYMKENKPYPAFPSAPDDHPV